MVINETGHERCAKHPPQTNVIHCCDAQAGLKKLPDACIDCVVTSPPYWATRDYGVAKSSWPDTSRSALGLEPRFEDYIEHLCGIFDEIRRVLKPTGTVWVNLGDTYHNSTRWTRQGESPQTINGTNNRGFNSGRRMNQGLPEKCLTLVPCRFAIEMTRRGWILRNDIVWHKPNHMPSSVKDRFGCAWEHVFLFVKRRTYHFDLDVVRVPHLTPRATLVRKAKHLRQRPSPHIHGLRLCHNPGNPQSAHPHGKNPGDYWTIPSEARAPVREDPSDVWPIRTWPSNLEHFAMFPEKLVEPPILAGCPIRVCKRCGTPKLISSVFRSQGRVADAGVARTVLGCKCKRGFQPGIVLDPFMGTGTTAVVARRLGRRFIGFELNPRYVKMARRRLADAAHESSSAAGAEIKKTA